MSGTAFNPLTPGQVWDCEKLTDGVQAARVGSAIQITASTPGTITPTLVSGNEIVVTVGTGDSIYPYQVSKATAGSAVANYWNLFT